MYIHFSNLVDSVTGKIILVSYDGDKLSIPKFNDVCYRTRSQISKGAKSLAKLHSVTL